MTEHILQVVWPITDDTCTRAELVAEAATQLDQLADQQHAIITGPPVWEIHPAADVPGWAGYAPRHVLIARAPAERYGSVREHRGADPTPDPAVVLRLIAGNPPARVRPIERTAAMAQMAANGADVPAVASRFGVNCRSVEQAMRRHRQRTPQAV